MESIQDPRRPKNRITSTPENVNLESTVVIWFNNNRGYRFALPTAESENHDIFLHCNNGDISKYVDGYINHQKGDKILVKVEKHKEKYYASYFCPNKS